MMLKHLVQSYLSVITGLDPVIPDGTVLEQMAGSGPGHDAIGMGRSHQRTIQPEQPS
jgi:hypothetical protein